MSSNNQKLQSIVTMISGLPGSGKTFRAVSLILKYIKQGRVSEDKVFHNISGLSVGKTLNSENVPGFNSYNPSTVFKESFMSSSDVLHNSLIVIDEAQEYFPYSMRNDDIAFFFQRHRHYNIAMILLTPDMSNIAKPVQKVCQQFYRAVSGSANFIPFFFIYNRYVSADCKVKMGTVYSFKSQRVFSAYKSVTKSDEGGNTSFKGPAVTFIIVILVVSYLAYLAFYSAGGLVGYDVEEKPLSPATEKTVTLGKDRLPDPVKEKKRFSLLGEHSRSNFPLSLEDHLGGMRPLVLSTTTLSTRSTVSAGVVRHKTDTFVVFMDTLIPISSLPYKTYTDGIGQLVALVPPDVWAFEKARVRDTENNVSEQPSGPQPRDNTDEDSSSFSISKVIKSLQ